MFEVIEERKVPTKDIVLGREEKVASEYETRFLKIKYKSGKFDKTAWYRELELIEREKVKELFNGLVVSAFSCFDCIYDMDEYDLMELPKQIDMEYIPHSYNSVKSDTKIDLRCECFSSLILELSDNKGFVCASVFNEAIRLSTNIEDIDS